MTAAPRAAQASPATTVRRRLDDDGQPAAPRTVTIDGVPVAALSADHAAAYCGTTPRHLETLRASGRGPRYTRAGRRVVYRVADLDQWLTAGLSNTGGTP